MSTARITVKGSSRKPKIKSTDPKSGHQYCPSSNGEGIADSISETTSSSPVVLHSKRVASVNSGINLKKEYYRYCKLYASEPLEQVSGPLEKATFCQGSGHHSDVGGVLVDLKGRGLRGVDCIALGQILKSNACINHLNLNNCLLLPQGFEVLLEGIAKNTYIEALEFRGNNIKDKNMLQPLGNMLKVNGNLKRLILEWNYLGTNKEAFQSFCDGLSINSSLEHLDLRNNQISDESTIELANAITHNKSMKDIDLRWNSIGVVGARAFYDLLNVNSTILNVQLGGNFVPDEIVQHIEQLLKQRSEQVELVKNYSARTSILTQQLQKTEEEYQTEIKNIMSIFDAEEKEYRRIINENQNQINRLSQERQDELTKNTALRNEVNSLKKQLDEFSEEEARLREQLVKKEQRVAEMESSFKTQAGDLERNFEEKLQNIQEVTDAQSKEKAGLITRARTAEAELQLRVGEVAQLKETILMINKTSEHLQQQFDERIQHAKESWTGFQTEIETLERKEILRLEAQMAETNSSLMEHVRVMEGKKADAEEEVRRMKLLLVTSKSETEEELTKLRVNLAEEHNASVKSYMDQISNLRQETDKLENEVSRLEGSVRKLEGENGKLSRHNEHLKQQLSQATEDINEIHASSQSAMSKTKNDLKDTSEKLAKEEDISRNLRSKLNEFEQQAASLSVKVNKLTQEKQADLEFWKLQVQRREDELIRLKAEDMRRAALLHEAFSVYMRSTSAATGLPIPSSTACCAETRPPQNPNTVCQSSNGGQNEKEEPVSESQKISIE